MLPGNNNYLRHFKPGIYEIAAFGIIALAILVRVLLIANGWPHTESDEGVIDLMALHNDTPGLLARLNVSSICVQA